MKPEITKFKQAQTALDRAEKALNRKVEKAAALCRTEDDFHELIDRLPKHYKGKRRLYEQMLRAQTEPCFVTPIAEAEPAPVVFAVGDLVKLDPPMPNAFSQVVGRVVLYRGKHSSKRPRVRWSSGWGTTCLASHLALLSPAEKKKAPRITLYPCDKN